MFRALKFRSMHDDAERATARCRRGPGRTRHPRRPGDARDRARELPQLWNILRGDMSFVGPRALRPGEIEIEGGAPVPLEAVDGYADRIVVVGQG